MELTGFLRFKLTTTRSRNGSRRAALTCYAVSMDRPYGYLKDILNGKGQGNQGHGARGFHRLWHKVRRFGVAVFNWSKYLALGSVPAVGLHNEAIWRGQPEATARQLFTIVDE